LPHPHITSLFGYDYSQEKNSGLASKNANPLASLARIFPLSLTLSIFLASFSFYDLASVLKKLVHIFGPLFSDLASEN
jgi:hypothetical protein